MNRTRYLRPILLVLALVAVIIAVRVTGLTDYLSLDNLARLRDYVEGFGPLAPLVFIIGYAVATVAFLPGTPLTLLAGLAFGPVIGSVYVVAGATMGLTLAFLVARYAARELVTSWIEENERIKRLDTEVGHQGWRILLITRLVPVLPFNLQNYAYRLTRILLVTYVLVSAICIVPGTVVYNVVYTPLTSGNLTRTFIYLGVAAIFFVILSFVPSWYRRRSRTSGEANSEN